jgi:sulfate transport system ATP-binding protein
VYSFLGNVNLFHGRVTEGRLRVGDAELEVPELTPNADESAVAFVRPHEFDVDMPDGDWSIPAVVERIRFVGPTARVELKRETDGFPFEAELPRQRVDRLGLTTGAKVRLAPRRYRVFPATNGHH